MQQQRQQKIGSRLQIINQLIGLLPARMATDLGISRNMVYRYLNNKNKPSYSTLQKYCKTYFVNIEWLLKGEGEPFLKLQKDRKQEALDILKQLAIIRVEKNITLTQIQEQLNLHKGYFTDLKKGTISMSLENKNKLREIYGVKV